MTIPTSSTPITIPPLTEIEQRLVSLREEAREWSRLLRIARAAERARKARETRSTAHASSVPETEGKRAVKSA